MARDSLAAEPKPLVALKVLKPEAQKESKKRQGTLLADLKEMQEKDEKGRHPIVHVLDVAEDLSWHTMIIIPGRTVRDILDKTYPKGLPPSLLLHIAHELVSAQEYLKTKALSRCHRDLKAGRNIILSYVPNGLPRVTLIDFNGIHPWREYKAVEHIFVLVRSLRRQWREMLEGMKGKGYDEIALEEAELFYETLEAYRYGHDSTFGELKVAMERFPPALADKLRDKEEEAVLNEVLQRPGITTEAVDNAVAAGGMEVDVV